MRKTRVLFVGSVNGSRSQMAEAWLNHLAGDEFEAVSAGYRAGTLNPLAVKVMKEIGLDISGQTVKTAFDLYKQGMFFNYIIVLCDQTLEEKGPIYPGHKDYIHWSTPDPDILWGTYRERLQIMREIRDGLRKRIEEWLEEVSTPAQMAVVG